MKNFKLIARISHELQKIAFAPSTDETVKTSHKLTAMQMLIKLINDTEETLEIAADDEEDNNNDSEEPP